MEIFIGIVWDVIVWMIPILCVILLGVLVWGIFRMGMSQGDPQRASGARTTITSAAIALVLLPLSLVGFRVIFADLISPNTGVDSGIFDRDCNRILMAQLVARANVRNEGTAQGLARAIQSQVAECASEFWLPEKLDDPKGVKAIDAGGPAVKGNCDEAVVERNGPGDLFHAGDIRRDGWICLSIDGSAWLYNPNNGEWNEL